MIKNRIQLLVLIPLLALWVLTPPFNYHVILATGVGNTSSSKDQKILSNIYTAPASYSGVLSFIQETLNNKNLYLTQILEEDELDEIDAIDDEDEENANKEDNDSENDEDDREGEDQEENESTSTEMVREEDEDVLNEDREATSTSATSTGSTTIELSNNPVATTTTTTTAPIQSVPVVTPIFDLPPSPPTTYPNIEPPQRTTPQQVSTSTATTTITGSITDNEFPHFAQNVEEIILGNPYQTYRLSEDVTRLLLSISVGLSLLGFALIKGGLGKATKISRIMHLPPLENTKLKEKSYGNQ